MIFHSDIIVVIIIVALLIIGVVIVLALRSAALRNQRFQFLKQSERVLTLTDAEHNSVDFHRVVLTNFGYGKEVWVLKRDENEIDVKLKAFKNGAIVSPTPARFQLNEFCQRHGCHLVEVQVKH
jgi:hypothetical protein